MTQNLADRRMDQESLEATAGVAYRPLNSDRLTLLGRYTHRLTRGVRPEVSTLGLETMEDWTSNIDLISLAGVLELPYGMQLTEKLVYKHHSDSSALDEFTTDQLLWINRFAVHLRQDADFCPGISTDVGTARWRVTSWRLGRSRLHATNTHGLALDITLRDSQPT